MEEKTVYIPNISCDHCVMTIKNELEDMEGIKSVEGDPSNKTIMAELEAPATIEGIRTRLAEINYPPA